MNKKLFFLTFLFIIIFLFFLAPGKIYADDQTYCFSDSSWLSYCQSEIGSPQSPVCCHSSSCSSPCGSIGLWDYCKVSECCAFTYLKKIALVVFIQEIVILIGLIIIMFMPIVAPKIVA